MKEKRLGVNIDHVATLRQARGVDYPDPVEAAILAAKHGADGITLHLREDRRHIQDHDLERLAKQRPARLNLEMAVTEEMLAIAERFKPEACCLVPEKREEVTTEGGLDILSQEIDIQKACERLTQAGIEVSLFIDPDLAQIEAANRVGAPVIELHTGTYANASKDEKVAEYERLKEAAKAADALGLQVNAGHGLHYENVEPIARLPEIVELNIGHSLIADAVMVGLPEAVSRIKNKLNSR